MRRRRTISPSGAYRRTVIYARSTQRSTWASYERRAAACGYIARQLHCKKYELNDDYSNINNA